MPDQLSDHIKTLSEMVTGKLLGDGSLTIEEKRKPRFRFDHSIKDREWCLYCFQKLSPFLSLNPPRFKRVYDNRLRYGYSDTYYVQSKTHPYLDGLKTEWYSGKTKVLPTASLQRFLTPLALAWWYQDDGHLKFSRGTPQKIILSCESFSNDERYFLKELLYNKFHLSFNTDKQKRLILYNKKSILQFLLLVHPHLTRGMVRKYVLFKDLTPLGYPEQKRVTIYLPENIHIQQPTRDIKKMISKLANIPQSIQLFQHQTSGKTNSKKGYQVALNREELYILAYFQQKTGLTRGECLELTIQPKKTATSVEIAVSSEKLT